MSNAIAIMFLITSLVFLGVGLYIPYSFQPKETANIWMVNCTVAKYWMFASVVMLVAGFLIKY